MKRGLGIIMARQVVRQIGTPRAELDSHVPPNFTCDRLVCDRLVRSAARLGGVRRLTQSYMGKRPISKRDRKSIRRFRVLALHARFSCAAANVRVTRSTAAGVAAQIKLTFN